MKYSLSKFATVITIALVAVIALFSIVTASISTAQNSTTTPVADSAMCSQILTNVEQHLSQDCNNIDKDHVCYGNDTIKVELQNTNGQVSFAKPGDVAPIDNIKSLTAGPLNPDNGDWGVAVLKLQTDNLAETTAGQAATVILYGDTTLTSNGTAVPTQAATAAATPALCQGTATRQTLLRKKPDLGQPSIQTITANESIKASARTADGKWTFVESNNQSGWIPTTSLKLAGAAQSLSVDDPNKIASLPGLNALYFTTNISAQSSCQDIPPSGMLVQSPTGHKINFSLNGAKVTMGSSLLFVTEPNGDVAVLVIEGQGTIQIGDRTLTLTGSQVAKFNALTNTLQRGDLATLLPDFGLKLGTDSSGKPIVLLDSLEKLFGALDLQLPTDIDLRPFIPPAATPVPTAALSCTSRTFNSNGTVCVPGIGDVPCNHNGVCDNGEHYFICPEDCGAPIPANPKDHQPAPMNTPIP